MLSELYIMLKRFICVLVHVKWRATHNRMGVLLTIHFGILWIISLYHKGKAWQACMLVQMVLTVLTGALRSARHWKIKAVMSWWRNWQRVDYTWKTNIKLTAASITVKLLLTIQSNMHCLMKKVSLQINLWKKKWCSMFRVRFPIASFDEYQKFDNQFLTYRRK